MDPGVFLLELVTVNGTEAHVFLDLSKTINVANRQVWPFQFGKQLVWDKVAIALDVSAIEKVYISTLALAISTKVLLNACPLMRIIILDEFTRETLVTVCSMESGLGPLGWFPSMGRTVFLKSDTPNVAC